MDDSFKSLTLMQEVATKDTVEKLYEKEFINQEGKDYALEFLFPHQEWGHWTAQIINLVGWLLILSGIFYLLIHHWPSLSTFHKISSFGISIFCCLLGIWTYSLKSLKGIISLLVACLLIVTFIIVLLY